MSDFLIVLVLMGVAVVLAVVVFNWWQEKKYRRRIELHFKQTRRDVLVDDFQIDAGLLKQEKALLSETSAEVQDDSGDVLVSDLLGEVVTRRPVESTIERTALKRPKVPKARTEPSLFSEEDAPVASSPTVSMDALNEALESASYDHQDSASHLAPQQEPLHDALDEPLALHSNVGMEFEAEQVSDDDFSEKPLVSEVKSAAEDPLQPTQLHTQMDLYAILHHRAGIDIKALAPLLAELKTFEQKTFALGFGEQQHWVDLKALVADDVQLFTHIASSIQLADRGGALDRSTIYRFQHAIETLGLTFGCHVEWQGGQDAVQQAQTIDQFCLEVDKAVEFHLLSNKGAFHATKLRGLAEANGLKLQDDGKFYETNNEGSVEFSLRNFEGKPFSVEMLKTAVMTGVTFQLDIPTVKNNTEVFDHMVAIANNMSQSLDAVMIDVNRKPIGDLQLEKIRQQLKVINATMIAKGITPGSQHALRLFS